MRYASRIRWVLAPIVVALLASTTALGGAFTNDDPLLIVDNPMVHDFSHLGENLTVDYFATTSSSAGIGYWRPLTRIAFTLEYCAFGARPLGYHAVSVVWLLLLVALAFSIARDEGLAPPVAAFAASLFAATPALAESVAIVASQSDLMAGVAVLATLLLHARGHRFAAALALAVGVGCKEIVVVTPGLLVAYELARGRRLRELKTLGVYLAPLLVYVGLRVALHRMPISEAASFAWAAPAKTIVSLVLRAIAPLTWAPYLHADRPGAAVVWTLAALGMAAASLWLWRVRRLRLALAFVWLPIVPLLNTRLVHTTGDPRALIVADRWALLPALGGALALAYAFSRAVEIVQRPLVRAAVRMTAIALVLATALTARAENASFHTEAARQEFIADALRTRDTVSPREEEIVLGADALAAERRGDFGASTAAYARLVELDPTDYTRRANLAMTLHDAHRDAEALPQAWIAYYLTSPDGAQHFPWNDSATRNRSERALLLGLILERLGDVGAARAHDQACLALDPHNRAAREALERLSR